MTNNNNKRQTLMKEVQKYSFTMYDALLYLDMHPEDQKAKEYFDKQKALYTKAVNEYERNYGPLTVINSTPSKYGWTWATDEFPWNIGG